MSQHVITSPGCTYTVWWIGVLGWFVVTNIGLWQIRQSVDDLAAAIREQPACRCSPAPSAAAAGTPAGLLPVQP
jgi:hypothetical protein